MQYQKVTKHKQLKQVTLPPQIQQINPKLPPLKKCATQVKRYARKSSMHESTGNVMLFVLIADGALSRATCDSRF